MAFVNFVEVKKAISIFLMSFYLALSLGVLVNLHYCMGEVNAISLYSSVDSCEMLCNQHYNVVHKKCCSTSSIYLNIEEVHSSSASLEAPSVNISSSPKIDSKSEPFTTLNQEISTPESRAGPYPGKISDKKYIQFQTLLFYS